MIEKTMRFVPDAGWWCEIINSFRRPLVHLAAQWDWISLLSQNWCWWGLSEPGWEARQKTSLRITGRGLGWEKPIGLKPNEQSGIRCISGVKIKYVGKKPSQQLGIWKPTGTRVRQYKSKDQKPIKSCDSRLRGIITMALNLELRHLLFQGRRLLPQFSESNPRRDHSGLYRWKQRTHVKRNGVKWQKYSVWNHTERHIMTPLCTAWRRSELEGSN